LLGETRKTGTLGKLLGEFEDILRMPFWEWKSSILRISSNLPRLIHVLHNPAPKLTLKRLLSVPSVFFPLDKNSTGQQSTWIRISLQSLLAEIKQFCATVNDGLTEITP
jgi:hypothetical protein